MPQSTCKHCDASIRWRELPSGKWLPINGDGSNHFTTCEARPRKVLPTDRCHVCGSKNVDQGPGAGPHFARLRCLDCQSLRWLPWPEAKKP